MKKKALNKSAFYSYPKKKRRARNDYFSKKYNNSE